ncbi:hypothetical protein FI667_g7691, partial [Globisporangium splendens]
MWASSRTITCLPVIPSSTPELLLSSGSSSCMQSFRDLTSLVRRLSDVPFIIRYASRSDWKAGLSWLPSIVPLLCHNQSAHKQRRSTLLFAKSSALLSPSQSRSAARGRRVAPTRSRGNCQRTKHTLNVNGVKVRTGRQAHAANRLDKPMYGRWESCSYSLACRRLAVKRKSSAMVDTSGREQCYPPHYFGAGAVVECFPVLPTPPALAIAYVPSSPIHSSTSSSSSTKKRKHNARHGSGESSAALVHPSQQASIGNSNTHDEEDMFITGAYRGSRKLAQNATHELRDLRQQAVQMENEITRLRARWKHELPDPRVLLSACETAKSKWITSKAEELNRQLKEQLLQQQLYLASLQNLVLQSPFLEASRSKEVFEALHTVTKLNAAMTDAQRRERLDAHCDMGLRMVPTVTSRFLNRHIEKATMETPFSHTSIMCDGNFTYVSNLLVCRIPHPSLQAVTDAVRTYFATMHAELKRHVGITGQFTHIEQLSGNKHYAQIRYENGPNIVSTVNTTLGSRVSDDQVIFSTDFIDEDPLHPVRTSGDGSIMRDTGLALVMDPVIDQATGQHQILLQRIAMTRYSLPPSSSVLHYDIQSTLQWLNGDLLLKVICQHLEQLQNQQHPQLTHDDAMKRSRHQ